jgi:hypothetical protein
MDDGDAGFPEQDDSVHAFTGHKGRFLKGVILMAFHLLV